MKKEYLKPYLLVLKTEIEDIIATSGFNDEEILPGDDSIYDLLI